MILLDLTDYSWENEDLFVKIGTRALHLWLYNRFAKDFGPKLP